MLILQQRNEDLEKCVKELEASNLELRMQLDTLRVKEQPSSPSGGMLIL
jgi:ribosomal protein L29